MRLKEYERQTAPLIQYYQLKNCLRSVQGVGGQNEIFERIVRLVKRNPWLRVGWSIDAEGRGDPS